MKLTVGLLLTAAISPSFTACNSSEDVTVYQPGSAIVRSFSLTEDKKVLPNLDSVYFSIDLFSGEIFNADSLPYGTKISALVPVILTDGSSVAELSVPRPNNIDTIINYLENSTDSVDFSNGPVKLRIISIDGKTERNYSIKVNVHTVPTDTLTWTRINNGRLPSVFNIVNEQHTTEAGGTFYCLTRYGTRYSVAVTDNPDGSWEATETTLPAGARLNSMTATTDGLYILDNNSRLYKSTDKGRTWTDTGSPMTNAIGCYGSSIIGTLNEAGNWSIVKYPGSTKWTAPSAFPVSGASTPVNYSFEMSVSPQMILVGGRDANGELLNKTWAFDGESWADITRRPMPRRLENMTMVPYYNIIPDTVSWKVSSRSSLMLAFCGNDAEGIPNDTVYMSSDFGMNWSKAPENLQMQTNIIPSRTHAQAFAFTSKVSENREAVKSRATAPITEWDVPFIFLFGGVNQEGTTYNTVFRGAIKQFTFKPLQ